MLWRACRCSPSRPRRWTRSGAVSIAPTVLARPPLRSPRHRRHARLARGRGLHGRGATPSSRPRSRPVGRAADNAHREPVVVAGAGRKPRAEWLGGGYRRRCRRQWPPCADPADGRQHEVGEARSVARGRGTQLQIGEEGPVRADDYDWYLVQAIGLPHRGWVAAADHDGEAGIEDTALASASTSPYTEVEAGPGRRPPLLDVVVNCAPRRKDLPERATAGVECRINTDPVSRIGAYRFRDPSDAALTYFERLALGDVDPLSGDRAAGTSGDAPGMPATGRPAARRIESPSAATNDGSSAGVAAFLGRWRGQCQADLRIDVYRHRRTHRGHRGAP